MTTSATRFERVRSLIEAEPTRDDDQANMVGWMHRLCRAASKDLPATGVGVSLMPRKGYLASLAASDARTAIVEDLQFTLGEGPCIDACNDGGPVFAPDLAVAARLRWSGYAPAAQEHGLRAAFAFPLQVGAARLGALGVYQGRPGNPSPEATAQALTFADAAVARLLDAQQRVNDGGGQRLVDHALDNRFELYQAQGMVAIQLGVDIHEAMVRIRAYAYAENRSLGDVADEIVARKLIFETDV